jgi:hypothetical protein
MRTLVRTELAAGFSHFEYPDNPRRKIVFDTGRAWRQTEGCEKSNGGNAYFTHWVEGRTVELSVLVCHLPSRDALLQRLLDGLGPQLTGRSAEILINTDDGRKSIGLKRNELLERARGRYVAFVDDDDTVAADYIAQILAALAATPEATHCELRGQIAAAPRLYRDFHHSNRYQRWGRIGEVYVRPPNHLNAIRIDLARAAGFPLLSHGEDRVYSDRLVQARCLTVEAPICSVLYHYQPSTHAPAAAPAAGIRAGIRAVPSPPASTP